MSANVQTILMKQVQTLGDIDDIEEAFDIVKNHIVVSDYYATMGRNSSEILSDRFENYVKIKYFEFSDGKTLKEFQDLKNFHIRVIPSLWVKYMAQVII